MLTWIKELLAPAAEAGNAAWGMELLKSPRPPKRQAEAT